MGGGPVRGEGTIRINTATRQNLGHLIVSVVNTDTEIIEFFAARWPARIKRATGRRPNDRDAWLWVISTRMAAAFLTEIRPFLVTQRVQVKADLALEYQAQKICTRREPGAALEYAAIQYEYYLRMRELNVRGRAAQEERAHWGTA